MEYQLPRAQAAELLGISERQLRRVLAAYRRDGAAALVHGNRGRKPRNSVPEYVATAAVILASEKYVGFSHSYLTEVLVEREGIHLSRQVGADIPECGECGRPWTADVGRHRIAVQRGSWEFICYSCWERQVAAVSAKQGLPAG